MKGFLTKKTDNHAEINKYRLKKPVLYAVFFVGLILLTIISFASYFQVQELLRVNNKITHTYNVIHAVNSSLFKLADLESLQRGYLISGQKHLLEDIDQSKTELNQYLQRLADLTKDTPEQNQRVLNYLELIEKRLNIFNQVTLFHVKDILTSKDAMELFNHSQDYSHRAKALGQEIKAIEFVLLKNRNEKSIQEAQLTSLVIIVGNTLSISILIIAFLLTNAELTSRKKTEYFYKHSEERLKKVLESSGDMVAAFDNQLRFIIFNDAYQREFKHLFGKMIAIGMSIDDALIDCPENRKELAKEWKDSLQKSETQKRIQATINHDTRTYEMTSSLMQGLEYSVQGAVQTIRDISLSIKEHEELIKSYKNLALSMQALQEKNQQISLLVEMSDIMLACSSMAELTEAIKNFSSQLLSFASGFLFIMHPSRNYLEKITTWGEPETQQNTFNPEQCWGIRLGRMHQVDESSSALICSHTKTDHHEVYHLCVPLMAQNDIFGLLYIETSKEKAPLDDENQKLLITAFSELTALALANIRLRENLRHQSIRDALTGLYNRRYLEEFLYKHIEQAKREEEKFAIMMLDLDHFKVINDTYGHEAGDQVLKEVGEILRTDVRTGDLACRYGGEEFVVFLYNINMENAAKRAENLRLKISHLNVLYGAEQIGPITASIGVAVYPKDGLTADDLINASDKALYEAKNKGRNQVVLYGKNNSQD